MNMTKYAGAEVDNPVRLWLLCFVLLHSSFCLPAVGQYSIDWYQVSGGGGTSTNGEYSVSGTIGQPDAGVAMSGGGYSLVGGFWSLVAVVQTPGAPTLTITHSGSSVVVSWPYPSSGFVLQQNHSLTTTNWTASSFTVTTNASATSVTVSPPAGTLFLRLARP
jgi:hypothetical protein